MSLPTPSWLRKLQGKLHAKAKAEPGFRFYSLWDKVCHEETLAEAYRRCRANGGAGGVDRETFEDIEARGREQWLGNLRMDLHGGTYKPQALRRVWIPKSNGKLRPLSIPPIRDRVVQMAVLLIIEPIFEGDLRPQQYGFRRGLDAKMAVRKVFFHIRKHGRTEVVDGDLRDYFTTIPHGLLMKCVARRISDSRVLSTIRSWLRAPVKHEGGHEATRRGVPQGGVISPVLSNLYFRRFVLVWYERGIHQRLNAHLVNYADDYVICCEPGSGEVAMEKARRLLTAMGLEVNEEKTRLVRLPEGTFDFLGYTFGRFYSRSANRPYLGTCPSKKAVKRVRQRIHGETSRRWNLTSVEERVREVNAILRGWCGYFDQGPVFREYRILRSYTERRLRRWLMKKHQRRGTGYRRYPDEYLYETLGLYKPWAPNRQLAESEGTTS